MNQATTDKNTAPISEWDKKVCARLDQLWQQAHSPGAVFYTPEQSKAILQWRIDAAASKHKAPEVLV